MGRQPRTDGNLIASTAFLSESEKANLDKLRVHWKCLSDAETIRRAISEAAHRLIETSTPDAPPSAELLKLIKEVREATKAIAAGFRLGESTFLLTREQVIQATQRFGSGKIEEHLLPVVEDFFREHVREHGWFYPEEKETIDAAMFSIRANKRYAGSAYLKAIFRSFWDVDNGPSKAFQDPRALRRVLRYRMGLNNSKPYTYKLSTGEKVTCRETFNIGLKDIRRGFIVQRHSVSFFRPTEAYNVYQEWISADRPVVWDPSCGFGARMLAFFAAYPDGQYTGNEPATQIHRDLKTLISALPIREDQVRLAKKGSEFAHFEPESLDFVFTSPPYFDLEKYYDEPGQCWRDYPVLETWLKRYLKPTLEAAYNGLKRERYAVFNVDEKRSAGVIEAALDAGFQHAETQQLPLTHDHFSKARGKKGKRAEPILVFRKP